MIRCALGLVLCGGGLTLAAPAGAEEDEKDEQEVLEPPGGTIEFPGGLEVHRPNYALPLTWTDAAEDADDAEFEFQFSLKYQVASTPVYVAYTQVAYFRWLDEENSRPLREITYNPQVWYRFRAGRLVPDWLGIDVGYEHQSNGEDQPDSRSWDRVYVRPWFDEGRWSGSLKLWRRVEGDEEPSSPSNPGGDDNPDILDYYGHHELRLSYTFDGGDRLAAVTRYAFSDDRGGLRLSYAHPTGAGDSYWYVQLFQGYGESLQTFKQNRTRIGVGVALFH
jgi:phospholipase A1